MTAHAKIIEALTFRDTAITCMSRKSVNCLKVLLEKLHNWKPCAIVLRHTGLPLIFMDTAVWAELKISQEADDFRVKFKNLVNQQRKRTDRNNYTEFFVPCIIMTTFNFKQHLHSMELFV